METEQLRVKKLKDYLIEVINEIKIANSINVNALPNETNGYSLERIPTNREVSVWITGDTVCQDTYNLVALKNYSYEQINNLNNIGFFEKFEQKIKYNNDNRILPEINKIESIQCLNSGTLDAVNENTAQFSIQIQITYREGAGK